MKGSWWKILGVLLMLYVIVVGFLMPLRPGIVSASPQSIRSGTTVTISASMYNGQLGNLEESEIRAWLVKDTTYLLQAESVSIASEQTIAAIFSLPTNLPVDQEVEAFSLVIDAPQMGSTVLPDAIFVAKGGDDIAAGLREWTASTLGVLNKHDGLALPFRNLLVETLRNTYFHVSLWFSMLILFSVSVVYSVKFLRKKDPNFDIVASSLVEVGTLFGILGFITGSIWARYTWGTFLTNDVKINMSAISMMIYAAYLVLRTSIKDNDKKGIISSSYNIFAFFIIIPLIFVIPRLTDSLHPGNGGNPGFGTDDMDNTMRMVFWPAIIAYTLIGLWMSTLMMRFKKLREKIDEI